jgi:hypothetical protein
MRPEECETVEREVVARILAIVQRYQDQNWRRLRVNDICSEIKCLIQDDEANRRVMRSETGLSAGPRKFPYLVVR